MGALICTQGPVLMQVIQDAVTWASAGDFQNRATATVTWTATSMETAVVTLGRPVNPHSVKMFKYTWLSNIICIGVHNYNSATVATTQTQFAALQYHHGVQ